MEELQVINLEDLLEFVNNNCGPSHSCGGGR